MLIILNIEMLFMGVNALFISENNIDKGLRHSSPSGLDKRLLTKTYFLKNNDDNRVNTHEGFI